MVLRRRIDPINRFLPIVCTVSPVTARNCVPAPLLRLTLMSGTFFDSVGGVIAVPLAAYFALWFIPGAINPLIYISPVILSVGPGDEYPGVALSLMNGEAPFSWIPLIVSLVASFVFIGVSIWRFNRQEF